jgi:putative acetyltransferase
MNPMNTRLEEEGDQEAVYAVNSAAFETNAEADLVNKLRAHDGPFVSLIAEIDEAIVGHIMFSPVELEESVESRERFRLPEEVDPVIYGLGPMAVGPGSQRRGIGSALVLAGLERCIDLEIDAIVVLGHPKFYPRFGFVPASEFGLTCEFDVPNDVFMAMELTPDSLKKPDGTVHYNSLFSEV